MSYKITIVKTVTVPVKKGRAWVKLGTKEVAREYNPYEQDPNAPKTRMEEIMGYSPEYDGTETREIEVLSQQVEDLDLASVIKAVNKL